MGPEMTWEVVSVDILEDRWEIRERNQWFCTSYHQFFIKYHSIILEHALLAGNLATRRRVLLCPRNPPIHECLGWSGLPAKVREWSRQNRASQKFSDNHASREPAIPSKNQLPSNHDVLAGISEGFGVSTKPQ
jgi:hypothetical protein